MMFLVDFWPDELKYVKKNQFKKKKWGFFITSVLSTLVKQPLGTI